MIPPGRHEPNYPSDPTSWRNELRTAIRSSVELCRALGLKPADIPGGCDEPADFPVLVPRSLLRRMQPGDSSDPLLRQVLALQAERDAAPGFVQDPLEERAFARDGIVRKYAGRALIVTTAACPVHCRYCFRRHFPYAEQHAARGRWTQTLDTLRNSPEIGEVILSGGDPLSLSTDRLSELFAGLETLDAIHTVRIHTRFPIMVPSRVTIELLRLLDDTRLNTVVVVHSNHANELADETVTAALTTLSRTVNQLLNQSVLLRGVNDSVAALSALSRALLHAHVVPYYLHLLDPVAGSAHFDVSQHRAIELIGELRRTLPGYLVPRLVREEPGSLSKTPLC